MRRLLVRHIPWRVVVCLAAMFVAPPAATAQTYSFDNMEPQQPAVGFTAAISGEHGTVSSRWRAEASPVWCAVLEEAGAPSGDNALLIISSDRRSQAFPVCLLDGSSVRDADLSTRFKPIGGDLDRAAGILLRARDSDNYYVVRANALENNVRFYRVANGRRTLLAGRDATVRTAAWQTLRITAEGPRFAVYLDGRLLFEASDGTFGEAGLVGLWSKSDSVTLFDDFAILPLDR